MFSFVRVISFDSENSCSVCRRDLLP